MHRRCQCSCCDRRILERAIVCTAAVVISILLAQVGLNRGRQLALADCPAGMHESGPDDQGTGRVSSLLAAEVEGGDGLASTPVPPFEACR